MSFFHKSNEELEARAALKAEKERLRVTKIRAKAAKAAAKTSRISGKQKITEARTRKRATQLQRVEEREEYRYLTAENRLERDRIRGRAKPVRVRGSRRTRSFRRSRPGHGQRSSRRSYRGGARYE